MPEPNGSEPGYRRSFVIVQSNDFNQSRIQAVPAMGTMSNLLLERAPGNLLLPANGTGVRRDSAINVSKLITVNKPALTRNIGRMTGKQLQEVDEVLRLLHSL